MRPSLRSLSHRRSLALGVALTAALALASAAEAAVSQVSSDPFTQATCKASTTTNHQTQVEPDSFANGSTIVAAYQVGRIYDGGACAIGFAMSTNNGATWTSGLLPGITKWAGGGPNDRATDASVAYDAKHNAWLVSSLTLLEAGGVHGNAVVTSRSTDGGVTWNNPFTTATGGDLDKNWIVCDNSPTSPFYGNCYTQWDDHGAGNALRMSRSSDGGQTWSAPTTNNSGVIGGQPVVRPDGTVIVPTANANETAIGAFNSTNGGASWSAVTTIATIRHHAVGGSLREGPLPSAEIDGSGTANVAWADCRFRRSCKTNDIVLSHSLNPTGTRWSSVTRVPIDATGSRIDHFIPGLAVNKATSGAGAQLGLTYYFYPSGSTQLSVGFISSTNVLLTSPYSSSPPRVLDPASGEHVDLMGGARVDSEPSAGDSGERSGGDFSSDGRWVVTATGREALVWDSRSGRVRSRLIGHTARVLAAVMSEDDRFIATASQDGTVRVWQARSGRSLAVLRPHTGSVIDVAFAPSGKEILSTGADGSVRISPCYVCLSTKQLRALASSRVTRDLTRAERLAFLGDAG